MSYSTDHSAPRKMISPVAITIAGQREQILEEWVHEARKKLKGARKLADPILINTLPVFLDNLIEALDGNHPKTNANESNNIAQEHGGERARLTDYSPEQIFQEYIILRKIIITRIAQHHQPELSALSIIQNSFDEAIQESMLAFYVVWGQMREKIVDNLTHDMRTPLTAAKLSLDMVKKKLSKPITESTIPEVEVHLIKIDKNLKYTNELIQKILDDRSLKYRAEKKAELLVPAEMRSIVETTISDLSEDIQALIRMHGEKVHGFWDDRAIRRAMENFISNAIKYGKPDSPIDIKIEEAKGRVMVSVHNFGIPIPLEQRGLLFNSFHRTQSAKETNVKGWGLGLAYCREVAEFHAGSLGIESNIEDGTTFTMDILIDPRKAHLEP